MIDVAEWPYVTPTGFPHGLRCSDCDRIISVGEPYDERLHSVDDDGAVAVWLVCVACAVSGEPTEAELRQVTE